MLLYYLILLPLSKLPFGIMYGLSDFIAFILHKIGRYRLPVIRKNLRNSFPEKTEKELKKIESKYYHHLADIFLEGLKNLSISKKTLLKRYKCVNPEILEKFYGKGKSVIWVSSHYNNWEWMVSSISLQSKFHGVGVGQMLHNEYLNRKINVARTKFASEVVFASNVRECFEKYIAEQKQCAYMMLFDQYHNPEKSYMTKFLNQETGFIYGPEYFAKKYDFPVFYYSVNKVKRGFYEFELKLITENPCETEYGYITQTCVDNLEKDINSQPEFWLWSHNRWKNKKKS